MSSTPAPGFGDSLSQPATSPAGLPGPEPLLSDGSPLRKGAVLTEAQLDDAVHRVQLWALEKGMIPIAAIISRRTAEGRHEVLGFGHNHLAEGIPGIHGETGALISLGRREAGYGELVATSSLNPCPFCQRTLACHLGIREVRILDAKNYSPDLSSYPATLKPTIKHHEPTAQVFERWVADGRHALLWERDIGIFDKPHAPPLDVSANGDRIAAGLSLAHQHAAAALAAGEAPIGAVVLDAQGEVIGVGHSQVARGNDPTRVAAMVAWRACGAREHWKDKTLLLTAGPDHIAYSMFHIFNFGQIVVASDAVFAGQLSTLRQRGTPVHVLNDRRSDGPLRDWVHGHPGEQVREYFGVLP